MQQIRLYVKGLSYSQTQSGAYALVLGEENGERRLPIIIGGFEAQSIAIALEKDMNPPRPLTHDLFKNFADQFKITLKEVLIHKLQDGVFYSILVCEREGETHSLDARTSDAVALAIRFKTPIFTSEEILDKAGVILGEGQADAEKSKSSKTKSSEKSSSSPGLLSTQSLESLKKQMDEAVRNEDYERAARLRDEIEKREGNKD
ncbi:bifunctional nuclease domain-containing protein [Croceimicrobium sp.]|uniref:bifunctional nuclease domain-containing protein n=1 Tax=Croceimicrobium sp. TaxID=2828340 RepID=UPI003BAAB09E